MTVGVICGLKQRHKQITQHLLKVFDQIIGAIDITEEKLNWLIKLYPILNKLIITKVLGFE